MAALISSGCPGPSGGPPGAVSFDIQSVDYAEAGLAITVTVQAIDSNGKVVPSYTGTIQFSSTDPQAVLPTSGTAFTAGDQGVRTFDSGVQLKTAGQRDVQVSDGVISGSKSITVTPGPANSFTLALTTTLTTTGEPITIGVTVWDSYGNIAENYKGPVSITSSDFQAIVPSAYFFTQADLGVHVFNVYVNSPGLHTVCVRDDSLNIQACAQVRVYMYTVPHYYIDADTASAGFTIPVTIISPSTGNPIPGANINATRSDSSAAVTGITPLGNCTYIVGLTMTKATSFLLTATCSSGCSGTPSVRSIITVTPGAVVPGNSFVGSLSFTEAAVVNTIAGIDLSPTVTVTLRDQFRNPVPFQKANIAGVALTETCGGSPCGGPIQVRMRRDNLDGTYKLWIGNGDPNIPQNGVSEEVQLDVQYSGNTLLSNPLILHFVSVDLSLTPYYQNGYLFIPTAGTGNTVVSNIQYDGWPFTDATVNYLKTSSTATTTPSSGTAQSDGVTRTTVYDPVSEKVKITTKVSTRSIGAADALELDVVTFSLITTTTNVPFNDTARFVLRAFITDPAAGYSVTAWTTSGTTSPANSITEAPLSDEKNGYYILDLTDGVDETNVGVTFTFGGKDPAVGSVITASTVVNFIPRIDILSVSPQSVLHSENFGTAAAGGGMSVTVIAQVMGVAPVTGRTVVMTASGNAAVNPSTAYDNGDGTYTAYVTDVNPETVTITAKDMGSSFTVQVQAEFVRVNLPASPSTSLVPGTIELRATIQGGTPADGRMFSWDYGPDPLGNLPVGTITIDPPVYKGGGVYSFNVTDTLAESFTIAITDTTSLAYSSVNVSFGETNIVFVTFYLPSAIGPVIVTTSSPTALLASPVQNLGGGQYSVTIWDPYPEKVIVTATDTGGSGTSTNVQVEFVDIFIMPATPSVKIGSWTLLTIEVGPGGGRSIFLSSSGSAMITPASGTTDSTGAFYAIIADPVPETVMVKATDLTSGATTTTNIEFYP